MRREICIPYAVGGSSAELIPERFLLIKKEPGGSDEPTAGLLSALSHAILDDMLPILSRQEVALNGHMEEFARRGACLPF